MKTDALVIFDCDGVLVDSERLSVGIEAHLLTQMGVPHSELDVVNTFMGRSAGAGKAVLERLLGKAGAAEFDSRSTAEIHAAFDRDLTPIPGIPEVLDSLRQSGWRTCVASSGSHQKMQRTLGLTGLYDFFQGRIFSAADVAHGKPAPDLFLQAAQVMGAEPDACVVVEDSVPGVQAGIAAGMRVYGFTGGLAPEGALQAAGALVLECMKHLPTALMDWRR
ncbi:HAD family hydrolase [Paenarthrobacter sp. Z7-10]|uniref:HAD family hydrolase n=1 Tax=Paenarthrobacter sp. Z7-10 TaxID=2787635 RepID=UPI0022A990F0|nr:HAD family hydrolase [Paenarthrobacter sp. Z7-10]MCZ2401834.1 HAD family hydrolase [Paenarthrobacter sp. Z7-10]